MEVVTYYLSRTIRGSSARLTSSSQRTPHPGVLWLSQGQRYQRFRCLEDRICSSSIMERLANASHAQMGEGISIPPSSEFLDHYERQHTGAGWRETLDLWCHTSFIPVQNVVKHSNAFASERNFSYRPTVSLKDTTSVSVHLSSSVRNRMGSDCDGSAGDYMKIHNGTKISIASQLGPFVDTDSFSFRGRLEWLTYPTFLQFAFRKPAVLTQKG